MSAPGDWQQRNGDYLAAALAWLQLRLRRLAEQGQIDPADPEIAQVRQKLAVAEAASPPPALALLAERFDLSRFEQETLLLVAATELDTRTPALCASAQGDPNRAYPTFALALALFDDPTWDALTPGRPLRYWQLLEVNTAGYGSAAAQPLIASALHADERIVSFLKGLNYLDDRLAPLLTLLDQAEADGEAGPLPPSQQAVLERGLRAFQQLAQAQAPPVVQLLGPDGLSKELLARNMAQALGLRVYRLPAESLASQPAEVESLARLWNRESLLLPVALYVDAQELDASQPGDGPAQALRRLLGRLQGLTFLAGRDPWPDPHLEMITLDVARPTPAEQKAAWTAALASQPETGLNGRSASRLAGQFNLNVPAIHGALRAALPGAPGQDGLSERLWQACLVRSRPRMEALAQRIDPRATWQDIVLPEAQERLLRQISAQVGQRNIVYDEWGFRQRMNRGLGINALFTGESGTGKTMAAEVLANDLQLDLYKIDLSAVVSKYIGETEKNLRKLFDSAEDGGAILFFDEADALFGKRSEVKDSHDRYANIEINYLLQRMEAYRGLAILATNMKSALDQAFLRRLRFIVNFPFPGVVERKRIWQRAFPPQTPTAGLDYDRLAHFNLTGGSIHSIALNAAFLAAQAGLPVSMQLVFEAIRTEFTKLERPVNLADFR